MVTPRDILQLVGLPVQQEVANESGDTNRTSFLTELTGAEFSAIAHSRAIASDLHIRQINEGLTVAVFHRALTPQGFIASIVYQPEMGLVTVTMGECPSSYAAQAVLDQQNPFVAWINRLGHSL